MGFKKRPAFWAENAVHRQWVDTLRGTNCRPFFGPPFWPRVSSLASRGSLPTLHPTLQPAITKTCHETHQTHNAPPPTNPPNWKNNQLSPERHLS